MKSDDVTRLEAAVRSANPVPQPADLVGSEESSAVMLLVREGRDPMTSTHTPQQLHRSGVRWQRAWTFVAAFVVVLLGIGTATLLLRSSGGPVVEQPEGTVQMGPVTWLKADLGDAAIPHVVALGGGFIGTQVGPDTAEIVTSPDGIVWSSVENVPLSDSEELLWRAGGESGAVAEVLDPDHAGIILTRDGSSFVRSDPRTAPGLPQGQLELKSLAIGDPGIVAVYHEMGLDPVEGEFILFSGEGETWQIIPKPAEAIFISELASTPFGILLTAEADSPDRPNPGMLTWILTHDLVWEELPITDEFIAGMSEPVGWGGGIIVAGDTWDHTTEVGTARVWHSPDTLNWHEVDATPFTGLSPVTFVGAHSGIVALAGGVEGPTTVMFSTDAETWETWRASDVFGGEPRWGEVASSGDTIVAPGLGSGQHIELWVGTIEGVEVPEEWPPATYVTLPATTLPTTTVAMPASLEDTDLATIANNLWLLMPTREEIADVTGMSEPAHLWWDTDSPWFVGMDEWWTAARWGAGHATMRGNVTPDVAFQFGVFETPEQAQAAVESISADRRFTNASLVAAPIDRAAEVGGFGVVLDRYADEAFVIEPEAEEDPLYVPFQGLDQTLLVAQRLDRVVVVTAMHSNDDLGQGEIVEVASVVADRASRFGELVENPTPRPSRDPQPLPWLVFSGAAPTFAELGIPTSYEMAGWSVEPCDGWMPGRCSLVRLNGRDVTGFDLNTEIPWGGFDRGLGPEEALETWITEDVWNDDSAMTDFRRFTLGGAPAVRSYTELRTGDEFEGAIIEVYMLTGNPMTAFRLMSWEDAGEGIDPELIRGALPLIDALLLEAEANS
ncbi:MAG: hypothetical protein ABFR89_06010 [Actinomycetota bacterium]